MKRLSFIVRLKYYFLILMGRCRCSGYGVYPNGFKCIGCGDCK